MKKLLYRILRKDMIRRLKVKHGEQFIEDVMNTFDLPFSWNKMQNPPEPPKQKGPLTTYLEMHKTTKPSHQVIFESDIPPKQPEVFNIDGQIYMASVQDIKPWPKDPPESKNLPDCNHDRFCDQQTIHQTCNQEVGCNFQG